MNAQSCSSTAQQNETTESSRVLFPIDRTLDYRVSQRYLVAAEGFDEAEAKLHEYLDLDGSMTAAAALGVVQVSDQMEQIENSHEISHGDAPIRVSGEPVLDQSMKDLLVTAKSAEMLSLLRKIAERPQMFHHCVADLGNEVKAFVDAVDASFDESERLLLAVKAKAHPEDVDIDA
ncbi:hypothetical protein LA345_40210 (plasmid) [Burkholderia vietnamiensis]|uniref:Uncharacterized protein n=1 Tax=Burkholderia vietnamiensis (strain G4 / LMG 22486) TaxID=269482 RepID=A4JU67_BURVG|nr:hypothetical protein Bcep1808_6933 [Burkholderia vietnamiensis G4]MCB4350018.1 hypothetical protein [Burkholderia vietnamiensis]